MDDEPAESKDGSAEEEEPLIPDDFDEEFYTNLCTKISEIVRYTRNKLDNAANADNIQRIQLVCAKYKSDLYEEEMKCLEIKDELDKTKEKLENVMNISKLDQDTIRGLKGVICGAWKQKDSAQAREQAAQEELYKLREKVEHMEVVLQRLADRRGGIEDTGRNKDGENKEIEKLKDEIKEYNKKLHIQRLYTTEVEQICKNLEEKNKSIIIILDETTSEAFKEKKKLDSMTKELAECKLNEDKTEEIMKKMKSKTDHLLINHVQLNLQLFATKTKLDQLRTLQNATNNKLSKALIDLGFSDQEREKLRMDLLQKINMLKAKEEDYYKLRQENSKIQRTHDGITRKMGVIVKSKEKVDMENKRIQNHVSCLEKELIGEQKAVEKLNKQIDILINERDHLKRELITSASLTSKAEENVELIQQELKFLNITIKDNSFKEKKLAEELKKSTEETETKVLEIQGLDEKNDSLAMELHKRENIIKELEQTVSESKINLNKMEGLLEVARNEKISLQRNIQQLIKEKDDIKENLKISKTEAIGLNEKIEQKKEEVYKLQIQVEKLEKERQLFKTEIKNTNLLYQHSRSELIDKRLENDRLMKVLQEDEQKLSRSKQQFENCIHEKNLIDSNLTKLGNDMMRLQDRLVLTQNALDQSEKSHGKALEDVRLMKIEIRNLSAERDVLKRDRECSADLRTELLQMHRVLNQERIKGRALQDEMLTPMNVHRWRTLGGKDPEKMDLIYKIQSLRKQILAQNVSALEKEKALEESHKLYTALKQFMVKLPSYKVKEQLNEMKHNLSVKDKKLKALTAELNTKEIDEKTKDHTLDELRANLTSTAKELTIEKKKKMKLLEERQIIAQMQLQCFSAPPAGARMFGAGFKMPYGNQLMG